MHNYFPTPLSRQYGLWEGVWEHYYESEMLKNASYKQSLLKSTKARYNLTVSPVIFNHIQTFCLIYLKKKNNFWLTEMYIQPSFALLLISTLIGYCYSETEEAPYKVENNCKNANAPTTIIFSRALRFAILQKKVDPCLFVHSDFATN